MNIARHPHRLDLAKQLVGRALDALRTELRQDLSDVEVLKITNKAATLERNLVELMARRSAKAD